MSGPAPGRARALGPSSVSEPPTTPVPEGASGGTVEGSDLVPPAQGSDLVARDRELPDAIALVQDPRGKDQAMQAAYMQQTQLQPPVMYDPAPLPRTVPDLAGAYGSAGVPPSYPGLHPYAALQQAQQYQQYQQYQQVVAFQQQQALQQQAALQQQQQQQVQEAQHANGVKQFGMPYQPAWTSSYQQLPYGYGGQYGGYMRYPGVSGVESLAPDQAPLPPAPPLAPPGNPVAEGGEVRTSAGEEEEVAEEARSIKRPRLIWTGALHSRFVDAVAKIGGVDRALPKAIMKEMGVAGLTRENVASHLQKYRMRLKRGDEGEMMHNASGVLQGTWDESPLARISLGPADASHIAGPRSMNPGSETEYQVTPPDVALRHGPPP